MRHWKSLLVFKKACFTGRHGLLPDEDGGIRQPSGSAGIPALPDSSLLIRSFHQRCQTMEEGCRLFQQPPNPPPRCPAQSSQTFFGFPSSQA